MFGVFVVSVCSASTIATGSHPIRVVLCVIWLAVLASYIAMDRGRLTGDRARERRSHADPVRGDHRGRAGRRRVAALAATTSAGCPGAGWGGAFCGFVAVLQYWLSLDLAQYLRDLPGFAVNHDNPAILARGSLNRVAGTAVHAIELGVVSGMLIPIASVSGSTTATKTPFKRWAPLDADRPRRRHVGVALGDPLGRRGVRHAGGTAAAAAAPGRPGRAAVRGGGDLHVRARLDRHPRRAVLRRASNDPSIRYRTHDYPLAEQLWQSAPWFGRRRHLDPRRLAEHLRQPVPAHGGRAGLVGYLAS